MVTERLFKTDMVVRNMKRGQSVFSFFCRGAVRRTYRYYTKFDGSW